MRRLSGKFEMSVNIGILIVALLFGGILVKRYLWPAHEETKNVDLDPRVPIGENILLPGPTWSSERTVLLVLSTRCRFCSESAPFYRQLANEVGGRTDIKLVATLPEDVNESQEYLKGLGVAIDDVRQVPLKQIDVKATPTLILVDRAGIVINSWVGKLPAEQVSEVFRAIRGSHVPQIARNDDKTSSIEPEDLQKIISDGSRVTIIDLRERSEYKNNHIEGALNIPFDELSVRASNELRGSDLIVVYSDCSGCATDEKGRVASEMLMNLGFSRAAALAGGLEGWAKARPLDRKPLPPQD